jgi:hypothetical protein
MDHTEAVRSNAAERYTLGDLPVGQVEEFERHFFECPQCSEELRILSILAENTRAVFAEQSFRSAPEAVAPEPALNAEKVEHKADAPTVVEKARAWWKQPWLIPAFAAIAIAIFAGTQDLQMRRQLNQIGQVSEFPLYAAARGSETIVNPRASDFFYLVYFDVSWEGQAQRAVLQDEAGKGEARTFDITDEGKETLKVRIPVHALEPGRYVLTIRGKTPSGAEGDLAHYPFTFRIE